MEKADLTDDMDRKGNFKMMVENHLPDNADCEDFQSVGMIQQLFIKSEDIHNDEANPTTALDREPDVNWEIDNKNTLEVDVNMKTDNAVNNLNECDINTNLITELVLSRIKNEYSELDNIDEYTASNNEDLNVHLSEVNPAIDVDSEDVKGTEITGGFTTKSQGGVGVDATSDVTLNGPYSNLPTFKTCPHCNAMFKRKAALDDHVIKKHPNFITTINRKVYECTLCIFKTVTKNYLIKHMATHSDTVSSKLITCTHCNATFKSGASLDDHIVRKHPDFITNIDRKIYECTECSYKTTVKNNLNKHVTVNHVTDSDRKSFSCILCDAIFKTDVSLDNHLIKKHPITSTSVTRKTLQCPKCDYTTVLRSHLNRHMLKHPDIESSYKPRLCPHCNKSFKSKVALDAHIVRRHPEFITSVTNKLHECGECMYKTTNKCHYVRHILTHSETSTCNRCKHCNKTFKLKATLHDHVIKNH
ncbi:unnamed protein product [Acanthoscelides obtectus]|nr:unnamed protein product [Acanthoscelides obtectus]CAK1632289.1 Zinc finger protein 425 [Acanthoscelides obtectus]